MGLSKRTKMLTVAAAIAATLLAGCAVPSPTAAPTSSPAAAATPTKAAPTPTKAATVTPTKRPLVKAVWALSSFGSLSHVVSYVAEAKGLFRDEGLDVERIASGGGPATVAAVVGGSADFGTLSVESSIGAIAGGGPALIIAHTNSAPSMVTLRKDVAERLGITEKSPLEDRARALKGLTITSVSAVGSTGRLARLLMQSVGLDPDRDAEFTYISQGSAQVAAMQQKRVDVISANPPDTLVPVVEGYGVVIFVLGRDPLPVAGAEPTQLAITTSRDAASKRSDVMEAVVRAHWRSLASLKQNPEEAIRALKQNLEF
ncbi:MAG: ABC transporter substrate-binding protein, partial [Chloroflexi bacterium]|nr:ABC transporter substrate-binding protein [Chloroflexota bacterium]